MMKRKFWVSVMMVSFVPAGAHAQAALPPPSMAAAVADSFLSRTARMDFKGATDLVDPSSLEEFRRTQVDNLRLQDSLEKLPERGNRDLPPAVAEYFAAQARKFRSEFGSPLELEFGVKSIAEAESMSGPELFARWLESQHPETRFRNAVRAQHRDSLPSAVIAAMMTVRSPRVLGAMLASDSVAYALFQEAGTEPSPLGPQLLPLRLTKAGWRLDAVEAQHAIHGISCTFGVSVEAEKEP